MTDASTPPVDRRWPKRLLIGAAALAALLGAAYAALHYAFPPQRVAQWVAERVQAQTGRSLRIDGGLSLQLLPRIGVVVRDVTLGNAEWGSQAQMLHVRRAEMRVELMPLLQRRVEVERVVLEGVDALLETDRDGRGNWVMKGRGPVPDPGGADGSTLRVALPSVQVEDARLRLRNGRTGRVDELSLQTLNLQREGDDAEWQARFNLGKQAWTLDGRTGPLAALADNGADWPFDLRLDTKGAQLKLQGQLLQRSAPGTLRGTAAASVTGADALAPWLDATLPLPLELRTNLHYTRAALTLDALTLSLAGQQLSGRVAVAAASPWKIDATLSSPSIDMAKLLPRGGGAGAPGANDKKLFSTREIPFGLLDRVPASVALSVEQLKLPGMPPLSALKLKFDAAAGRAQFEPFSFAVAGGTVRGGLRAQLDAPAPQMNLQLSADNLSAEAISRAAGAGDYLRGGKLQLRADLDLRGGSSAALAASANGELLASARDMKMGDGAAPIGPNLLPRILQAVRLQPAAAGYTQVECAVVRLPLKNGVADIDRSIAVQTPDLSIVAKGVVDLRNETLELALRPNTRQALDINTAQLASLVMLKGPLLDPGLSLDVKGAAGVALSIGAAAATGGLSLFAQNLMRQANDPQPCVSAATGAKAAPVQQPAAPRPDAKSAAPSPGDVPRLLRKLFK